MPSIPLTIQTTEKLVGLVSSTMKKEKHLHLSEAKEYRLKTSQKLWKACTLANTVKRFRKRTQDQVEQLIKQIAGFVCGLNKIVWHKKKILFCYFQNVGFIHPVYICIFAEATVH